MKSQGVRRSLFVRVFLLAAALSQLSLVSAADSFSSLVAEIEAANERPRAATITAARRHHRSAAPLPAITRLSSSLREAVIPSAAMASIASFDVSGGALTLANVTLSEGKAPDGEDGGALRVRNGARVSIENSTFRDNLATNGGAVALAGGRHKPGRYQQQFRQQPR